MQRTETRHAWPALSAPCSRVAAWLLVPYLLWCLYATTLRRGRPEFPHATS